jgi:hypothetical protein
LASAGAAAEGAAAGLFGACLGHGPPDNSGHKRRLTDTSALPFTWGNAECQPLPIHWFFPDTEEVTVVVTPPAGLNRVGGRYQEWPTLSSESLASQMSPWPFAMPRFSSQ